MERPDTNPFDWIALTRLAPPQPAGYLLPRPDLTRAFLDAVRTHPLTLISSPGGYGKTILLSALTGEPDLQLAWLTLDESDDDPLHFFRSLLAAIDSALPGSTEPAQQQLNQIRSPVPALKPLVGGLINSLQRPGDKRVVLALDDLHAVSSPQVHELLDYLIEFLPSSLCLAIATRREPPLALGRLRARGKLAEFRQPKLAFTSAEIETLFAEAFGIRLAEVAIDLLESATEGWPAGLRILASALEGASDPAEATRRLEELASADRFVFEFFAGEVLDHQEAAVRQFLLETSILAELTPELCREVTGRPDAAIILEQVFASNLFLSAVRSPRSPAAAYRYHNLFRSFLRHRLAQHTPFTDIQALNLRAARALPDEAAIPHLLHGELWEEAGSRILQAGHRLVRSGYFGLLRGWINKLPDDARAANPGLMYFAALCAFQHGDFTEAEALAQSAKEGFEARGDKAGIGESMLLLGGIAGGRHDTSESARLLLEALEYPLSPYSAIQARINQAWVGVYTGDWRLAERAVDEALALTYHLEEPGGFSVLAPHLTILLAFIPDGVNRLDEYARRALEWFGDEAGPVQIGALALVGSIEFFRGQLDEGERAFKRAERSSRLLGGFVWLDIGIDLGLLSVFLARQDFQAFESHWQSRLQVFETTPGAREYLAGFLYFQGRALLAQNRLNQARRIFKRMEAIVGPGDTGENQVVFELMRGAIATAEGREAEAEDIFLGAVRQQQRAPQSWLFCSARAWLAHLYWRQSDYDRALTELAAEIGELERRDMTGLLLRDADLLDALLELAVDRGVRRESASWLLEAARGIARPGPIEINSTGEKLSPREGEVLRLLMEGLSNREIAARLVVSETTVKSHVTAILRKMNVRSRAQAAAAARSFGIR